MDTKTTEQELRNESGTGQPGDGPATEAPSPSVHPHLSKAEIQAKSAEELRQYYKDLRGHWRSGTLFEETCEDPAKYPPIFTLNDDDTASCVSLKRLYMSFEDVTEWNIANHVLGGWDHWTAIVECNLTKDHIAKWRRDLEMHLRAKYIEQIRQASTLDGPVALQATKYLLETTTALKNKNVRGRPSKVEKEQAIKEELRDTDEIRRDMERLGLKVIGNDSKRGES